MANDLLIEQLSAGQLIRNFWRNTEKLGRDTLTLDILNNRLLLLETYWDAYVQRHHRLYAQSADLKDTEYFAQDLFAECESHYITARTQVVSHISTQIEDLQVLANPNATARFVPPTRMSTTSSSLPKLKLPRFGGKQEDWDTFKELFCSMVKNDPSLTPVLKLQHLVSCLEGDAARRVNNFQVTGANFEVAWHALETRYDNKRLRLSVQLNRLLNMKPASSRSVNEITRLLDNTNESIRALRSLGRPVDQWDDWFVQVIVVNLDAGTREDWEKSLEGTQTFPTFTDLSKFLENRTKALDAAHCSDQQYQSRPKSHSVTKQSVKSSNSFSAHASSSSTSKKRIKPVCVICKGDHFAGSCPTLLQNNTAGRYNLIDSLRLCINCLRPDHSASSCSSRNRCRHCNKEHHSLLHREPEPIKVNPGTTTTGGQRPTLNQPGATSTTSLQGYTAALGNATLLGTAQVILQSLSGEQLLFRALIDPASEGSFVTEKVVQAFSLHKSPHQITVSGVGGSVTARSSATVTLTLRSRILSDSFWSFSAAVLPRLTSLLPARALPRSHWDHLQGLTLADPEFDLPRQVDCLLGADLYPAILLGGVQLGPQGSPVAQETKLGWILTGPTSAHSEQAHISTHLAISTCDSLGAQLRSFWEVEEVPATPPLTNEERDCEQHFRRTHRRDQQGRYVVRLPFLRNPQLPGSRSPAMRRLLSMERKLAKDEVLSQKYGAFLQEYHELGHMEIAARHTDSSPTNYVPHHAVVRKDESRKIRVVFDASQPSANGKSLNDFLHVGPKLQQDISTILTRWRLFRYVFTADIVKMFRQIRIHPDDARWQRILWRATPEMPMQEYQLLTVTYGTACAPYLAIRVLQQLAEDEGDKYPVAASILRHHIYVDDALAGADTLHDARLACRELQEAVAAAGMDLGKWSANHPAILSKPEIPDVSVRTFEQQDAVSTLGLQWSPGADAFHYKVQLRSCSTVTTKRSILSEVARLYDPLGWLAPIVVRAKVLLQLLWLSGTDWDSPVSTETRDRWENFTQQLPALEALRIPRWCGVDSHSSWHLHGFSDASEKAYAAAVYLVLHDSNQRIQSTLLAAKSKVAPIKTVSLPRLELCGAVLLVRLLRKLQEDLRIDSAIIHCWTDSQVVLAWLQGHPNSWKTFVANRVSEILTSLPTAKWAHVRSALNPADLATRGSTPDDLIQNQLWWKGPLDLLTNSEQPPSPSDYETDIDLRATTTSFHTASEESALESLMSDFSSLSRMIRVISFALRWLPNAHLSRSERPNATLSAEELRRAKLKLILAVQAEHYAAEIALLRSGRPLAATSALLRLNPFIGDDGLLRVGGRLQFSILPFNEKHPAILPRASCLITLLIDDAHIRTLHGGPQLVHSHLLRQYWIPQVRNSIRMRCRLCVRCRRFQGRPYQQQMAPLPSVRITPTRPFHTVGVDYAGPFMLRTSKGRGQRSYKGYIAVFTCFSTKAVHIEVVSDYTSQTFLLAFKRFVARRGLCSVVFSDNGTTFQGADSELRRNLRAASNGEMAAAIQAEGVRWCFIPPRAPHFGGLWEAAVKSFKKHLQRVIGDSKLTFEELTTLTSCIEACLNSRPLSPMSADPTDLSALTPGHFLVGTALTAPPEPTMADSEPTGVARWKLVTQMHQHFWRRWRKEVLHHLQQRSKWLTPNHHPSPGDLVLLTDDQQPPLRWPLARIEALHAGPDGLNRVATLRTSTTTLQRPLVRLIPLPINSDASSHFTAWSSR